MSTVRTWEVYRSGWDHPERVKAVSGERACDMVSRSCSIPRNELIAHPGEPREGESVMRLENDEERRLWRDYVIAIGPGAECLVETMCTVADRVVEEYRARRQPDPIPDAGPTPADMRGEVTHG
jgi:hypothetical protein